MDILSIDTDTVSSLVSKLNRTGVSVNDAKTTTNGSFSRLKGSSNLYSGIDKISNNFSVIGDRFSKLANNINIEMLMQLLKLI